MKIPFLMISDSPSSGTGLGRICRELAVLIHRDCSDIFDVATFGYGGFGDRNLPFQQYFMEGIRDWMLPTLPNVWENFAGNRRGVIFTIWDASRMLWFARPEGGPQRLAWCPDPILRQWLMNAPFERWGYFPMDAVAPGHTLSVMLGETIAGYDRVIAYSDWAKKAIERTFSPQICEKQMLIAIPHGIDTDVFKPVKRTRGVFRQEMSYQGSVLEEYEKVIGIVATNQTRKDYGLAFAALSDVCRDTPARIFIQIDTLERHWSLPNLAIDFNLASRVGANIGFVTDEVMNLMYSACDLTLGIGPEGFGYPIFESLASGTPVIAGSVGGHAEHMSKEMLMRPIAERIDTVYNCVRPVYDPSKWAFEIRKWLKRGKTGESLLPERLAWKNLWANEWQPHLRRLHQKFLESVKIPDLPSNNHGMSTATAAHHTPKVSAPVETQTSIADPV